MVTRFGHMHHHLKAELEIPRGSAVDAAVASADVEIAGELGSLAFRSDSGDLSFDTVRGPVTIKVASGDVSGGAVGGNLSLQSASGDLQIRRVGGSRLHSASGDLEIARAEGSVQAAIDLRESPSSREPVASGDGRALCRDRLEMTSWEVSHKCS